MPAETIPKQNPYSSPEKAGEFESRILGFPVSRLVAAILNLAASIQLVWFYVNRIPPHIHLLVYEQGRERTPFQYRLLMMYPMRWAHQSAIVIALAHRLNATTGLFPNGVRPEGLVEAPINLLCVVTAGLVARRLYKRSSPYGLLTPYIYPLTLVMIATTYCLLDMHLLRFIYDLPSLALFALGIEAIYFRRSSLWFGTIFSLATVNRETSLFLLVIFAITYSFEEGYFEIRRLYSRQVLSVIIPLAIFWVGWHEYVVQRYAANASQSISRVWLNAGILLLPLTWPQMLGACGYLWLLVWMWRGRIPDPALRAWIWVAPAWVAFMLYYGIIIETRIFGELIPYVACVSGLLCEERILACIPPCLRATAQQPKSTII
jgi:hypothetical protein